MADALQMAPNWETMKQYAQTINTECWLMCLRMMYSYKNWDEFTIEGKLSGAGIQVDSAKKTTGLLTRDYMKAAKAVGLHPWGAGQSWSASDFRKWLTMGPVWVAGRWNPAGSHNVVVVGASDTKIRFIDPWNDVMPVAEDRTWDADTFIKGNPANRASAPGTDFYMTKIGAIMNFASFKDIY
ncbi:papain-like cysteine protease family protein [Plastoroseomonas arctica]|uniref:Uncharacterized protein n=1 Tax=Plastoroseomonas arctica TaxID=1509237 RepID=A0AAF1JZK8_9PROT|nr:papain-like cysteine protease family protein [Plastoroseomonas arctica]MBR0656890.1 hypothetical protein [Plastoroseomonas arctica]